MAHSLNIWYEACPVDLYKDFSIYAPRIKSSLTSGEHLGAFDPLVIQL